MHKGGLAIPSNSMRKLCPNFEKEDGLETVLEVPIPEEMLLCMGSSTSNRWQNLRSLMKAQSGDKSSHLSSASNNEFMALLKLVGSPLVPVQVQSDQTLLTRPLRDCSVVSIINSSIFSFFLFNFFAPRSITRSIHSATLFYKPYILHVESDRGIHHHDRHAGLFWCRD